VPTGPMDRDHEAEPLRIVVADGDALLRKTLAATLQEDGITVVAEAGSGDDAVDLTRFYHPHVVLVGDRLAGMGIVRAVQALLGADPNARVVILTATPHDEEALAAVRMGAAGYLSKDVDLETLPRIPRGVGEGEAAISRRLSMMLAEFYRRGSRGAAGLRPVRSTLTDREWEVLDLLASGARTEDIARTLVLSTETVRSHLKNLYRKLGVRSRAEAIEAAERLRDLVV
jgi:two-component system, NarL family, response regulator LiaR